MTDPEIKKVLSNYNSITVVGMSNNPERASHKVSDYLIHQGYEVDGVHPKETEILGCKVYPQIEDVPHQLEIVDVFRAPEHVLELVAGLIQLRPKVIWLQEGVGHPEAEERARQAGILVVSNKCILKEHKRLVEE